MFDCAHVDESACDFAKIGNFTAQVNSRLTASPHSFGRSHYRPMDSLKKIVGRIDRRLTAVGLKAATASLKAGLSSSAIYNLRRGAKGKIKTTGGNAHTFSALAPVLKTSVAYLMTGDGPETVDIEGSSVDGGERSVRVVGYVGAGGGAYFFAVAQGDLDTVPAPDGATESTVAVEIRGDSLGSLFNRWLVFYDDVREEVTSDLIGRLCVVGLADGRVLIKKLMRGKGDMFTLISDDKREDPITDVAVIWAARVKNMVPR